MARTVRISALQLAAHDLDAFAARREHLLSVIERSARACDLLVLPEATFPGYVLGDADIDDAAVAAALESLQTIAQRTTCAIVAGAAMRRNGALYNSAVAIDRDGSIAGQADKAFLWHFDRKWFAPGDALEPVRTSIGTLGLLICADGRMPAIARTLVDRGAEILVMPTAWVTSGRDPESLENVQADLLARVRAFENNVPFVAANKCGTELAMVAYCGKSQIVRSDGTIAVIADERSEMSIAADVELASPQLLRSRAHPPRRSHEHSRPRTVRVAIGADAVPTDIGERLAILDAETIVAPDYPPGIAHLDEIVPTILIDAAQAFDPTVLLAARSAGERIVVLDARATHPWLETVARARALELRMFVILIDRVARRACAIDPNGAIVAGSFDDYRIASFSLDARLTEATMVAPGTDVAAGIERIDSIARKHPSAR